MIFIEGLDKVKPTDVLGDIMTDAQHNDDEDEVEEKKETKVKQEKTIAFKASSSKERARWRAMMMIYSMMRPWPSLCTRWQDL
jgi:hypothetical protein